MKFHDETVRDKIRFDQKFETVPVGVTHGDFVRVNAVSTRKRAEENLWVSDLMEKNQNLNNATTNNKLSKLSRGEICVANFKAALRMVQVLLLPFNKNLVEW